MYTDSCYIIKRSNFNIWVTFLFTFSKWENKPNQENYHSPTSNGTPVPGIQEFPAKKFPTVNFAASVAPIT